MKYKTPHYMLLTDCNCSLGTAYRRFTPVEVKSEKELTKRWVGYKLAGILYYAIHFQGRHCLFDPWEVPKEQN